MQKIYFKNLDVLRFIAFCFIFLFHSFYTPFQYIKDNFIFRFLYSVTRVGILSVNFFFILSGFLISYLLLAEEKKNGTISIINYYIRRTLRIWPLYFLMVFIGFVIFPLVRKKFGDSYGQETAHFWMFPSFLSNFNNLRFGTTAPTLQTLWTVSIEEQFYLFWPILYSFFTLKKKWIIMVGIILLSLIFRCFFYTDYEIMNIHTLSVVSDMAMGGLLAWFSYTPNRRTDHFQHLSKTAIRIIYLTGLILCVILPYQTRFPIIIVFERIITGLYFCFIIWHQAFYKEKTYELSRYGWMVKLGQISYGLYCYHYLFLLGAYKINDRLHLNTNLFGVLVLDNLLAFALTILAAYVSYRFFESKFLKFKEKFQLIKSGASPQTI